jgi:YidC/Oxa1 family membrane protein insertase
VVGEPGLDTLGLATWWPPGRIQLLMEWMHIDIGLEWWQTILATTLCVRLIVFPVVIKAQRNMAHMNNNAPMMTRLQASPSGHCSVV